MSNDTLTIDVAILDRVIGTSDSRGSTSAGGGGRGGHVGALVTPEVLAETRTQTCRCEEPEIGLVAGMPVASLIDLGSGCTGCDSPLAHGGGWVCERLDKVRRRFGR